MSFADSNEGIMGTKFIESWFNMLSDLSSFEINQCWISLK